MSVTCTVGDEERKHGIVEKCIGCPCSLAIAKVLKSEYVVKMGHILSITKFQVFDVFPLEACHRDPDDGVLYVVGSWMAVYTGRVPKVAKDWQDAHMYLSDGGHEEAAVYTDAGSLSALPDHLKVKTLENFSFRIKLPLELVRPECLPV